MNPKQELELLNKYKGKSIKAAEYALRVAEGFYQCLQIKKELKRLK